MRKASVERETKETKISVTLNLDGDKSGKVEISTGMGFFDHMLTAFGIHAGVTLTVSVDGDLHVDAHHTVEDTGIVLGQALAKALDDKSGIQRYGFFLLPMDESLAKAVLDVSGRPYLDYKAQFTNERIGEYETCLTEEFFRALCVNAGFTLHLTTNSGGNDHHKTEAIFKAFGHALRMAVGSRDGLLSTKGML
ncbi:MAG: imidazoleglycerol-phosphate dehydratase HisB [Oscillospiraceae bacterium]|jgi:imidazoleglycerol-phosphate dehydratase|nr:imidazoleglycerol-phosphate dehydratase HisB [Oscillospiraceae bacterium]